MVDNGLMVVNISTETGDIIQLTPDVVRNYLAPGQKITDPEMVMFLQLCRAQNLNPFLREAYIIKYGDYPASIVVGKETFTKRAARHMQFDGYEVDVQGDAPNMTATAKVYRKDISHPFTVTVHFDEYVGKTYDKAKGGWVTNKQWASKPRTMLRKVALVQALREAFPTEFAGMYSEEEMDKKPYEDAIDVTPQSGKPEVKAPQAKKPPEAVTTEPTREPQNTTPLTPEVMPDMPDDTVRCITEGQKKLLYVKAKANGLTEDDIKEYMHVKHLLDIPADAMNNLLVAIQDGTMKKAISGQDDMIQEGDIEF